MDTHYDFVSVYVDMSLHQGYGFRKYVVASSNQIDVQHNVIPHKAEDSLIIIHSLLRSECDNNASLGLGIGSAFHFRERKHVLAVGYELEGRGQVAVIYDVQQAIRVAPYLHFSEVD